MGLERKPNLTRVSTLSLPLRGSCNPQGSQVEIATLLYLLPGKEDLTFPSANAVKQWRIGEEFDSNSTGGKVQTLKF